MLFVAHASLNSLIAAGGSKRPGSTDRPRTIACYLRNTSTAASGEDFKPLSGSVTIHVRGCRTLSWAGLFYREWNSQVRV
jgi:hypothetical protein